MTFHEWHGKCWSEEQSLGAQVLCVSLPRCLWWYRYLARLFLELMRIASDQHAAACFSWHTLFFLVDNNSLFKRSLSHELPQNTCIYAWVSLCVCSVLVLLYTHLLPLVLLGWRYLGLLLSTVVMFLLLGPSYWSWDLLFTPTPSLFPKLNSTILAFLVTSTF